MRIRWALAVASLTAASLVAVAGFGEPALPADVPLSACPARALGSIRVVIPGATLRALEFEVHCRIRPGAVAWAERRFASRRGRLQVAALAHFGRQKLGELDRAEIERRLLRLAEQSLFPDEALELDETKCRARVDSVRLSD